VKDVKAVILTRGGDVIVANSLSELEDVLAGGSDVEALILIRGEVLSVFKAVKAGAPLVEPSGEEQSRRALPDLIRRAGLEESRTLQPKRTSRAVAIVLDQMFRGFAGILERELEHDALEIHEIVGRGLPATLKISERVFQEPANDDFDVLKLVENLASRASIVVFFTGDKKLAKQASLLGLHNVVVKYMPPNEYPGKESLAKAMIETVRSALEGLGE